MIVAFMIFMISIFTLLAMKLESAMLCQLDQEIRQSLVNSGLKTY